MPITRYYPIRDSDIKLSNGISITYTKGRKEFDISGWYDTYVGIQSTTVSLAEFLQEFGITLKDCEKALEKPIKEGPAYK